MRLLNTSPTAAPAAIVYTHHVRPTGWGLLLPLAPHSTWPAPARTARRPRIRPTPVAFLLVLLCSALSGTAQTFHLSGGYSASNVQDAGDEQWVGRGGYQFGADVLIGRRAFFKPGLHFVVRNLYYTLGNTSDLTTQEYRYTSNMLSVPLLVGVNLLDPVERNAFNAYLMAGPTALIQLTTNLEDDQFEVETRGTQWYVGGGGGLG
jgi:hypothetical protein